MLGGGGQVAVDRVAPRHRRPPGRRPARSVGLRDTERGGIAGQARRAYTGGRERLGVPGGELAAAGHQRAAVGEALIAQRALHLVGGERAGGGADREQRIARRDRRACAEAEGAESPPVRSAQPPGPSQRLAASPQSRALTSARRSARRSAMSAAQRSPEPVEAGGRVVRQRGEVVAGLVAHRREQRTQPRRGAERIQAPHAGDGALAHHVVQCAAELRPALGARLRLCRARADAQHRRMGGAPARRGELADLQQQRVTRLAGELVGAVEDEEELAAAGERIDERHRGLLEDRLVMQHDDEHVAALGQCGDCSAVLLVDAVHVGRVDQHLRGPRSARRVVAHHLGAALALASVGPLDLGGRQLADVGIVRGIDHRPARGRPVDPLSSDAPPSQRVEEGRFAGPGGAHQRDHGGALHAPDLAVEVDEQAVELGAPLRHGAQAGDDREILVQAGAEAIEVDAEVGGVVHRIFHHQDHSHSRRQYARP